MPLSLRIYSVSIERRSGSKGFGAECFFRSPSNIYLYYFIPRFLLASYLSLCMAWRVSVTPYRQKRQQRSWYYCRTIPRTYEEYDRRPDFVRAGQWQVAKSETLDLRSTTHQASSQAQLVGNGVHNSLRSQLRKFIRVPGRNYVLTYTLCTLYYYIIRRIL